MLPYIWNIGICHPKGYGFLRRCGLKTDIGFAHFGLELSMGFKGITGLYERICRFNYK